MIGGRLLSVRDAIGHPANDWLSALGWCVPRDPLSSAVHSRDTLQCASLTAVELVHRSFGIKLR